ncbi:MAG: MFS transporter [Syntrophomonadaceae bacterium]|nr:MFS transporter [Syntrophomonadaceae bacterium]
MEGSNKWLVLFIVSIGIFMSTLDSSILNIANPTIANDFSVPVDLVQWVSTSYMMVITATLLLFGRLGDRIGNDRVYTGGFLLFAAGSWLCSTVPTLGFLILSRIFQGIGASMLMATGIGIVSNTFPAAERGKALGLTGTVVGIGTMTGPSVGGFLVATWGWPAIFLINVPIGVMGFLMGWKYFPEQPRQQDDKKPFDLPGLLLMMAAVVTLLTILSQYLDEKPVLLVLPMLLLTGFYFYERQSPNPLLDFELLRIPQVLYGSIQAACSYMTQTFPVFLIPFYLEKVLGFLPSQSGLMMTILPVSHSIVAPLAGSLSDRIGPAYLTSLAFLLQGTAHLIFASLQPHPDLVRLGVGLVLMGIGNAMFGSPNNSSILGACPREKAGYAGGFVATIRNLFYALGIATSVGFFTFFLQNNLTAAVPYTQAFTGSLAVVYRIAAAIALLGLVISWETRNIRQPAPPQVESEVNRSV